MKYKYNFKKFFNEDHPVIQDEEWISNGHFAIKKQLLRKPQSDYIAKFELNGKIELVRKVIGDYLYGKRDYEYIEFIPAKIIINFKAQNGEIYNLLIDKDGCAIKEQYYNFIMDRKCILSIVSNNKTHPLNISKEGRFVGILLQVRIRKETFENAENISDS